MFYSLVVFLIVYLFFLWSIEWVKYFNKLDKRFGSSIWRWSYDYPVLGKRDISILDDKKFVLLRRQRNRAVTIMYSIFFFGFIILIFCVNQILFKILN
tara:strand:+ start:2868 stop:3161 length:294 start_codon:yes stop_codon:yes gene_type:complete